MSYEQCKSCKELLPFTDEFFYRNRGVLWAQRCKNCTKNYVRQWREAKRAGKKLMDKQQLMARKDVQEVAEFAKKRGISVRFEVE